MEPNGGQPSPASSWKKTRAQALEVPSGNTALVERRALSAFAKEGNVLNGLMPLIEKAMKGGPQTEEEVVKELETDPKLLVPMLQFVDQVVLECVREPKVHPVPDAGEERDDDLLYVDEVDLADKMAIFAFVTGGVRDLEKFRGELALPSEDAPDEPADVDKTQHAVGS